MDTRPKTSFNYIKQTKLNLEKGNYQKALNTADKALIASINEKTTNNKLSEQLSAIATQVFTQCRQPEKNIIAINLTSRALQLTNKKTNIYDIFIMNLNMSLYLLQDKKIEEAAPWVNKAFELLEPKQLFHEVIIRSCLLRANDFYNASQHEIANSILIRLNQLTPPQNKHLLYEKMLPELYQKITQWLDTSSDAKSTSLTPQNSLSTSYLQKAYRVYTKIREAIPSYIIKPSNDSSSPKDTKKPSLENTILESIKPSLILHYLNKILELMPQNKLNEALAAGNEVIKLTSTLSELTPHTAYLLLKTAAHGFGKSSDANCLTIAINFTLLYLILSKAEDAFTAKMNIVFFHAQLNDMESAQFWLDHTIRNIDINLPMTEELQDLFIHFINLFHNQKWNTFTSHTIQLLFRLLSTNEKIAACKKISPQALQNEMHNDSIVLNAVGEHYSQQDGQIQTLRKANQLFYQSALLGNHQAMLNLASNYHYGMGTTIDLSRAIEWYAKSLSSPTEYTKAIEELTLLKKNHPAFKNKINSQLAIFAFVKQDIQTGIQLSSQITTSGLNSQECNEIGFFLFSHYQSHFELLDYYFHSMQHRTAYSKEERQARLFDVICKYLQEAVQKNQLNTTLNPYYNPNSLEKNEDMIIDSENTELNESQTKTSKCDEDIAFENAEKKAAKEAKRLLSNIQNSFLLKGLDQHLNFSQQKTYKTYDSNTATLFRQTPQNNHLRDEKRDNILNPFMPTI